MKERVIVERDDVVKALTEQLEEQTKMLESVQSFRKGEGLMETSQVEVGTNFVNFRLARYIGLRVSLSYSYSLKR